MAAYNGSSPKGRNQRPTQAPARAQTRRSEVTPPTHGGKISRRVQVIIAFVVVLAVLLVGRLFWVQVVWGPELSAHAQEQRERVYVEPARRGDITDRSGNRLAYTMQARSLTVSPVLLRRELAEQGYLEKVSNGEAGGRTREQMSDELDDYVEQTLSTMSEDIPKIIADNGASTDKVDDKEILDKLQADTNYEVLVRNVDPDIAAQVAETYHGVAADHQDIRQYPNGAVAENVIGKVSVDGQGQFGYEASGDNVLAGANGRMTEDVSADGQVIPGSLRDNIPAQDGEHVQLTLDLDLQTYVQQQVQQAKDNSGAKSAEAVVLDSHTGQVMAMANTDTIDPNGNIEQQIKQGRDFENPTVSAPYEPGSVAKVITAAGVIEEGASTPDEVLQVPDSIDMEGVTVRDAWPHGVLPLTTTGVFGKSSNVGTLMLAQRLGEDTYAKYLDRFGIGQATGIELPNESSGLLPPRDQWSGGTFANLPIGQGMSLTTLQMASVFQALANDGERIQPRIVDKITGADGKEVEQPAPETTKVVSPNTAHTVVDMFRAITQADPSGVQQGTGVGAGIEGYQISGKTGTAQKVDPDTQAYSNDSYWITFAGIAPADDPRYVIAVMVDNPERGVQPGGAGGQSAAPLFKDIASWLLDRNNVPLSPPPEGTIVLQAG